jgi:hypothetical protein
MASAAKIFLSTSGVESWQALIQQIFYSNGIGFLFGIVSSIFYLLEIMILLGH